ncbi:O-methylpimelyl-ACP methylesterase [Sphingomonas sp. DBB INV C78]|uniref:alpha/beta fold hydrolase n=1 Tax=Sphingomonas sp. DBB INV C78 TaxID=3349434 RepID=UPI0036D307E8
MLLCVHGLTGSGEFFAPQAGGLADRFRIIRIDLRGHGDTAAKGELTVARLTADIEELVVHCDLHDAIGIGWSLGAMLLWGMLLGPERRRLAGAIVVDMSPRVANGPDWTLGLIDEELRASRPGESWEDRCRRIAQAIVADGLQHERAELIDRMAGWLATADADAVTAIGLSMMEQDFRDRLALIETPVLIAHGARSQYYAPATSIFLLDQLPSSTLTAFKQSGHTPHLEEPQRFNAVVAGFAAAIASAQNMKNRGG